MDHDDTDDETDIATRPEPGIDSVPIRHVVLRILATTDLHMRLDDAQAGAGLARIAPVIAAERTRFENVLLFDNGDLIEGSALANEIARAGLGPHDTHLAIAALNHLRYDAATLGNHDFTHGVDFLRRVLRDAAHPITLANAGLIEGIPPWTESLILPRQFLDAQGQRQDVLIGVFGVLPPQTVDWELGLSRVMRTENVMIAAMRAVSSLRARGADVIIALSHGGHGHGRHGAGPENRAENAAGAIAEIPGVDAVIAGHTHEVVLRQPEPGRAPIAKPGFGGSHLAAISLSLRGHRGNWRVGCTEAELLPAGPDSCPDLKRVIAATFGRAEARLAAPVARSEGRLTSHYALMGVDPCMRLIEAALRDHIEETLAPNAAPALYALAPFRAGGRSGPGHYIDIPAGHLTLSDLSTLYPFPNYIAAIQLSGAEIADWLECAARLYNPLVPSRPVQSLIDQNVPAFQSDMIGGLDYAIDLTKPSAFDVQGSRIGKGRRISSLRFRGQPVEDNDRFTLVTNSYRLARGQPFAGFSAGKTCCLPESGRLRVRQILARHLAHQARITPDATPWFRLTAPPGTTAFLDTAPDADITACPVPVRGQRLTATGFQRLSIRF